jgi:hypothetical protein
MIEREPETKEIAMSEETTSRDNSAENKELDESSSTTPISSRKDEGIVVGRLPALTIPSEPLGTEDDAGSELAGSESLAFRRSRKHEWITLRRESELTTRLLRLDDGCEQGGKVCFYVNESLRNPIAADVRPVRIFCAYSRSRYEFFLVPIWVTPGNPWYESQNHLLSKPAEFFAGNEVRIFADQDQGRYRFRQRPAETAGIDWPGRSTGELLREALGPEGVIDSPEHPVYRELVGDSEIA